MKAFLISVVLIIIATPFELQAQQKRNDVRYENTEWTNIWIPSATKTDLPRVLLIGNSITQGYYPVVETFLKGKAYVARYTSSRGIIDPVMFNEIKNLITHHKFDVIHFNNGLHGIDYDAAQYEKGLKKLVRLLEKHGQDAVLIGATSTRVLPGYPGWKTDELNLKMIEERNLIMFRICHEKGIEVDDLFNVTADYPEMFSGDKIHYTQAGYKALGTQATSFILKKLIR